MCLCAKIFCVETSSCVCVPRCFVSKLVAAVSGCFLRSNEQRVKAMFRWCEVLVSLVIRVSIPCSVSNNRFCVGLERGDMSMTIMRW